MRAMEKVTKGTVIVRVIEGWTTTDEGKIAAIKSISIWRRDSKKGCVLLRLFQCVHEIGNADLRGYVRRGLPRIWNADDRGLWNVDYRA